MRYGPMSDSATIVWNDFSTTDDDDVVTFPLLIMSVSFGCDDVTHVRHLGSEASALNEWDRNAEDIYGRGSSVYNLCIGPPCRIPDVEGVRHSVSSDVPSPAMMVYSVVCSTYQS